MLRVVEQDDRTEQVKRLAAMLFVVIVGVVVFWPVDTWRLYDSLARPLALTETENFCSGLAVATQAYDDVAPVDPECLEKSAKGTEPSISNSVQWACEGIYAGDSTFPISDCVEVVESMDLWFLLDGGYTWYWSEAWPRPVEVVVEPDDPRAGSRGDFGEEYGAESTTTTTEGEETND